MLRSNQKDAPTYKAHKPSCETERCQILQSLGGSPSSFQRSKGSESTKGLHGTKRGEGKARTAPCVGKSKIPQEPTASLRSLIDKIPRKKLASDRASTDTPNGSLPNFTMTEPRQRGFAVLTASAETATNGSTATPPADDEQSNHATKNLSPGASNGGLNKVAASTEQQSQIAANNTVPLTPQVHPAPSNAPTTSQNHSTPTRTFVARCPAIPRPGQQSTPPRGLQSTAIKAVVGHSWPRKDSSTTQQSGSHSTVTASVAPSWRRNDSSNPKQSRPPWGSHSTTTKTSSVTTAWPRNNSNSATNQSRPPWGSLMATTSVSSNWPCIDSSTTQQSRPPWGANTTTTASGT